MRNNFHYSTLNCNECCTMFESIQSIRMHNQEVLYDVRLLLLLLMLLLLFFWIENKIN